MIIRDIADKLHDRRIAAASPGATIARDTDALVRACARREFRPPVERCLAGLGRPILVVNFPMRGGEP